MGYYEASVEKEKLKVQDEEDGSDSYVSYHDHMPSRDEKKSQLYIILTSSVQGFTGTGQVFGIAPALSMPDLYSVVLYFLGFTLGTVVIMAILTAAIGEVTHRMIDTLSFIPDLHIKLSKFCSGLSIVVGVLFILYNLFFSV
eukprot:TRINITY_DN879_c0_g1_i1.p2 TRINITY_DN879_c0_g1~~TRINITY_DN879_c0_g1_i1.p2  ORF type:complete len:142 (-),score=26.33 TRINITY_DN879_c0_g1_i1:58-483(-)